MMPAMSVPSYLACDLGAESGRCILGSLHDDGRLLLEELHRFANSPMRIASTLRWDLVGLFREMMVGLRRALAAAPGLRSVSVDSWGVDYVWRSARQPMLALPYCYRDGRNDAPYAALLAAVGRETIFRETGVQFMAINSLYQLRADVEANGEILAVADGFLFIADYFNFLFGAAPKVERSLASTSQLYHPSRHAWSAALAEAIGLPPRLLPEIVPAGERLGRVRAELVHEAGGRDGQESAGVATCSHDTGAAVAAVPAAAGAADWAYLVSGTWSLLGLELPAPRMGDDVLARNFTNEVGYGGSVRFLKNISGLWLLQEARRGYLQLGQEFAYAEIVRLAEEAGDARAYVNPTAARFARPGGMLEKIAAYCRETGQPVPATPGEYFRLIFESLALLYRQTLLEAEELAGRTVRTLHVVGGGSQNKLLNRFTADATGRTLVVGPVEATAIGNVLVQAIADGRIGSLDEGRALVARSFPPETLRPQVPERWRERAERFARLDALT